MRQYRREASRRRERIDLLRRELVAALGGRCATPGCRTPRAGLEIDHVNGCTWSRASAGRAGRHLRYLREYRAGVALQVLCRSCNAAKNRPEHHAAWAAFYAWARAA